MGASILFVHCLSNEKYQQKHWLEIRIERRGTTDVMIENTVFFHSLDSSEVSMNFNFV